MRRTKFIDRIRRTFLTLCLMATASVAWAEAVEVTNAEQLKSLLTGSDQELKLTADITLSKTLVIKSDVIIDLNGHTITSEGCRAFQVTKGEVLFKSDNPDNPAYIIANGSVPVDNSVIRVGEGGPGGYTGDKTFVKLTIGENVTISTTVETCYGVTVFGNKTEETLIVNGNVNTVGRAAIAGNGLPEYAGTTITVGENAKIKTSSNVAIYHPQAGVLTVIGSVEGAGGIEMKGGQLVVDEKAMIKATGTPQHTANENDPSTIGYAISIVESGAYAGVSNVNISPKATITGEVAVVKDSDKKDGAPDITFDKYGLQMKVMVTTTDNGVEKTVGQYTTLERAMSEAPAESTIKLMDNFSISSTFETSQVYTLDLNGHTITSDGQRALWVKSGNVTITSSVEGGKITVPTITDNDKSVIRVGSDESADVSLTVGQNVTISADECYGVVVEGQNTNASLTVKGNVSTKNKPAIAGQGPTGPTTATISIGSTANINASDNVAIYNSLAGTVTIDGTVTVKGAGGIEMKGGSLAVTSTAHIIATGTPLHVANDTGCSSVGYAVAVVQNNTNGQKVTNVSIDSSAEVIGAVAQLHDSDVTDFNPSYTGKFTTKLAAIGNDQYFSLNDAIKIVPQEGIVKLLMSLTQSTPFVMDAEKTYTFDLNTYTLTGNGCAAVQVSHGHVTMTNGIVTSTGAAPATIQVGSDEGTNRAVSLLVSNNVEVSSSSSPGVLLSGTRTRETLDVKGKVTTVTTEGHSAIVTADEVDKIHVYSGAEVTATDAVAIYQANVGDLVVDGGGKVIGSGTTAGAIEMKGGDLTVDAGAIVTATGSTTHRASDDAPSTNGYAIALVENTNFPGVGRVNISNSATVTGIIACIVDSEGNKPRFTGDVSMIAKTTANGNQYAKISDAIGAVAAGAEVMLLDNLTVTSPVELNKALILNMDDYSIIGNQGSGAAVTVGAGVTLKNGGITSEKDGININISDGTVALQNMTVTTAGVSLTVAQGTVTTDQKTNFTSTGANTIALNGGNLTVAGKVQNTSNASNASNAIEATAGSLSVANTATVTSTNGKGIDWQSSGELTIEGGKISGTEAVYANAGKVIITGGTFTGKTHGVEIAGYSTLPEVTGGTFVCGTNDDDKPIAYTGSTDLTDGFVTGDYFSKKIAQAICKKGYTVAANPKSNHLFYLINEIVINDGTNWTAPSEPYTIATAKYVRNSGMGAAGTEYGTLCLPFSFSTTTQDDMTFYKVASIDATNGVLNIENIEGNIAAGTPVIFQLDSRKTNFTIESAMASVTTMTDEDNDDALKANGLVGRFTKKTITDGLSGIYYLNSDAFHQAKTSLTVPAFRAYIQPITGSTAKASVLNIHIVDEDEVDGIGSAQNDDFDVEAVYDLQGRKQNGLQKGMNIMKMSNGKTIKVYVNK
ncbi:MAG: hypothetical protein MJZ35_00150 [Bacteroidaceae bacterium]|nr:hypothetical protein [Bacteroidaceae bacterium]